MCPRPVSVIANADLCGELADLFYTEAREAENEVERERLLDIADGWDRRCIDAAGYDDTAPQRAAG